MGEEAGQGWRWEKVSSLGLGQVWCPSSADLCRGPTALQLRLSRGRSDTSPLESTEAQEKPKLHSNQRIMGLLCYTYNGVCYFILFYFICGCSGSWLLRGGFLSCDWRGLLSSCGAVVSLVVEKGSRVQTLECRLRSCGTWA